MTKKKIGLERRPAHIDEVAARLERKALRDAAEARAAMARRKQGAKRARALEDALTAVNEGRAPSIAGCTDVGVIHVVDPHDKVLAVRPKLTNLRDDPIGLMHRRKQLGEKHEAEVRLKAARHLQALYEISEIGGARGIDPTKPIVSRGSAK
jgi:hypothetical protein